MQYEDLTGDGMATELRRIKEFVGVDPEELKNELAFETVNCRRCEINPEGWPMSETLYSKLIEQVKPDVEE